MKEIYCGIDCAKKAHEIYISGDSKTYSISNTAKSCNNLAKKLKKKGVKQVIFESTGGYEERLATALREGGIVFSIVNPYKVKSFAKAKGISAKTDPIDAKVLCEFGEQMNPEPTKPKRDVIVKLRKYLTRRGQLVKIQAMEKNHRQAPLADDSLETSEQSIATVLKANIKAINKAIIALIEEDSELNNKHKILSSFNGVGSVLTAVLLAYLPELGELDRKQISALVGIAPYNHDSGSTIRGYRSIQGGRKSIRDVLYMSALSSIQHNPMMRRAFQNLRSRGKPHKVAMVACMRKELIALNAMIRDGKAWSTERFSVSKDDYDKQQETKVETKKTA